MKTLLSHRSIRKYQNRPIEKEILDEILKAVQAAPNWVNLQHISVIVVQEQQRRKKFAELCGGQKRIAQAPVFLVFCADFYRTWLACKENGQEFDSVCKPDRQPDCWGKRGRNRSGNCGGCRRIPWSGHRTDWGHPASCFRGDQGTEPAQICCAHAWLVRGVSCGRTWTETPSAEGSGLL